jgi:hypothetical protein
MSALRLYHPGLTTARGEHYLDILTRLIQRRLAPSAADAGFSDAGPSSRDQNILPDRGASQPPNPIPDLGADASDADSKQHQPPPAQVEIVGGTDASLSAESDALVPPAIEEAPLAPSRIAKGGRIDKSLLSLAAERRLRDPQHLRDVAAMPCLVCDRQPAFAHHLKFAQRKAMSLKVSDEYVVPLCALHHGDLHRSHSEKLWWQRCGIDPLPIAANLWAQRNEKQT